MWVSFLDLGCQIIQVSANFIFEQQTVLILHIYPSQLIVSLLKFRHKWAQYIGTWTICFKKVSLTSAEHSWKVVKPKPILLWTNKHLLWFTLSESSVMSSKIIDLLVTWLPLMAWMVPANLRCTLHVTTKSRQFSANDVPHAANLIYISF